MSRKEFNSRGTQPSASKGENKLLVLDSFTSGNLSARRIRQTINSLSVCWCLTAYRTLCHINEQKFVCLRRLKDSFEAERESVIR